MTCPGPPSWQDQDRTPATVPPRRPVAQARSRPRRQEEGAQGSGSSRRRSGRLLEGLELGIRRVRAGARTQAAENPQTRTPLNKGSRAEWPPSPSPALLCAANIPQEESSGAQSPAHTCRDPATRQLPINQRRAPPTSISGQCTHCHSPLHAVACTWGHWAGSGDSRPPQHHPPQHCISNHAAQHHHVAHPHCPISESS